MRNALVGQHARARPTRASRPSCRPTTPPTPSAELAYATAISTPQCDGIADLPQSPLNLVSDLAFMGYFSVHDPMMTPDQIAHAVPLPTSPDYPGDTQYYDTQ